MPTECIAEQFDFGTVEGRAVEAAFDAGLVTSDAGALLLRATDRAIGLMDRFAACCAASPLHARALLHDHHPLCDERVHADEAWAGLHPPQHRPACVREKRGCAAPSVGGSMQEDRQAGRRVHQLRQLARLRSAATPQSKFSVLIRRIKARKSPRICGRPPKFRDFQRQ